MTYKTLMKKVDSGDAMILAWEDTINWEGNRGANVRLEIYRAAGRELNRPKTVEIEVTNLPKEEL